MTEDCALWMLRFHVPVYIEIQCRGDVCRRKLARRRDGTYASFNEHHETVVNATSAEMLLQTYREMEGDGWELRFVDAPA